MTRPEASAHSLLHCHFESALRALAVARPGKLERLRPAFEHPSYVRTTPAERLTLLDGEVARLTRGQDIFTREVFDEVVRRLGEEMTSSGIRHVDLRVGVLMHRWPWIGSLADTIEAFRSALPGPDTLTVSFLGAVNLSKPHDLLDTVFGRITEDTRTGALLTGLDINMQPADLATLDRYLAALHSLQRGGLRINIHLVLQGHILPRPAAMPNRRPVAHRSGLGFRAGQKPIGPVVLGELFGAAFSRRVLSRIIPSRIGHGVLLLEDAETVRLIREHGICLDMCPVSNTRLGVWDWTRSSPAARAMHLGLPVTINSDDPLLFGAGLASNLALAGLSRAQLDAARLAGSRYGYRR